MEKKLGGIIKKPKPKYVYHDIFEETPNHKPIKDFLGPLSIIIGIIFFLILLFNG